MSTSLVWHWVSDISTANVFTWTSCSPDSGFSVYVLMLSVLIVCVYIVLSLVDAFSVCILVDVVWTDSVWVSIVPKVFKGSDSSVCVSISFVTTIGFIGANEVSKMLCLWRMSSRLTRLFYSCLFSSCYLSSLLAMSPVIVFVLRMSCWLGSTYSA